jgi:hypothetical protein
MISDELFAVIQQPKRNNDGLLCSTVTKVAQQTMFATLQAWLDDGIIV